ncbi:uncharacterized protein LOC129725559 [Wyeomyia smithii]|uniref:uncharacterized protein LOC129725559 n=1 Tax=Wyeomyia smithii TaxID=174621 RepID=UPI002467FA25|nr:uncharacterized protein LOC129725559 [Wyeomyia smithii]
MGEHGTKYEEDILRPLSREELCALRELYCKHYTVDLHFYFFIKNALRWQEQLTELSESEKMKLCVRAFIEFYTPKAVNPLETGTFVAVTKNEDPNVYFHSLTEEPAQLEKYLCETKRIDWTASPVFSCVSDQFADTLANVLRKFNCKYDLLSDCSYYKLSHELAVQCQFQIPEDLVMKPLEPRCASVMNERWPHRYPNSQKYIEMLIKFNGGYGLFNKESNDLVGWVLKNEFAGIGHLQVMPEYRQRGLGEVLTKAISKRIALEDKGDVNGFIVDENLGSIRLLKKIGYQKVAGSNWVRAVYGMEQ